MLVMTLLFFKLLWWTRSYSWLYASTINEQQSSRDHIHFFLFFLSTAYFYRKVTFCFHYKITETIPEKKSIHMVEVMLCYISKMCEKTDLNVEVVQILHAPGTQCRNLCLWSNSYIVCWVSGSMDISPWWQ